MPTLSPSRPLRVPAVLALALLSMSPVPGVSAAPAPAPPSPRSPVTVAVSVAPLAWLAESVGGERVRVTAVMIPPGASPETYSPGPRQVVAAAGARLYVAVGHPHLLMEDRYVLPVVEGRTVRMIAAGEAEAADPHAAGPHADEHEHAEEDPHPWVDPVAMAGTARRVAAALTELDPAGEAAYRAGLERTLAACDELDRRARELFARRTGWRFLVQHPAWGPLARRHGLEQVPVEAGHRPPSAARIVRLIEENAHAGFPVVFTEPGRPARSGEIVARGIGARLEALDPLPRDWPAGTRAALERLAAGLAPPAAQGTPSHSLEGEPSHG